MLAVLKGVHYFRTYLDGQKFLLHTDHSALKDLLRTKEPRGSTARWMHKLSEMDFQVLHRPCRSIGHADALCRLPQDADQVLVTIEEAHNGRIVIRPHQKVQILEEYHDSPDSGGHDGIWRTYLKTSKRSWWPNLRKEVTE